MRQARYRVATMVLFAGLVAGAAAAQTPLPATACTTCHGDSDLFDAEHLEILGDYRQDVHAQVGLSCHDCHGGNPAMSVADDMIASMDESFELNPYRGAPAAADIPGFCGECHSSPSYMRRFKPDARVDQEREYWTSQHGEALAAGDQKVATCVSCHGNHGIRRAADPESGVYPTHVAETCGGCHSNKEYMAGYKVESGRPLPINQQARWQRSVHAEAMFGRDDLSAPTCNDCHGNHGAAPPGLESLTFICGSCHGREAELFRGSAKHAGFEAHNEYVADAGEAGCAACHEPPEPQAWVTGVDKLGECTSCHYNHGTVRPTVAMFGVLPAVPCAFCHENPELLAAEAAEPEASERNYSQALERLVGEGTDLGLEGDDLYNWMVDSTLELPQHAVRGEFDERGRPLLRPEFERLFEKFRIGKTYYTYEDPVSGEEVRAEIVRCSGCHVTGALVSGDTPGARTGHDLVDRMSELTALTARAERILLRAHRGGVEIREALLEIDQAVDAQIALEVLVHEFDASEGSAFIEAHDRGLDHARAAIDAGLEAQQEIQRRRHWLALALIAVVAVLVALGLKIRELSRQERLREEGVAT